MIFKERRAKFLALVLFGATLSACSEVQTTGGPSNIGTNAGVNSGANSSAIAGIAETFGGAPVQRVSQPVAVQRNVGVQAGVGAQTAVVAQQAAPAPANQDRYAQALAGMLNDPATLGSMRGADIFSVRRFYQLRNNQPAFSIRGQWSSDAYTAVQELQGSVNDGLTPHEYLPVEMLSVQNLPSGQTPEQLAAIDIWLTAGSLAYARDVFNGRMSPTASVYPIDQMARQSINGGFSGWLQGRKPSGLSYNQLRGAFASARDTLTPEQVQKVKLNLERLRTMAEPQSDKYVRVNIPGFTLQAYDSGREVLSMNVVVGRNERVTPILNDRIVNLKYSPDWQVPPTVVVQDFLPKLRADPNYLASRGITVSLRGKEIPSSEVDTSSEDSIKSYVFRQPPGGQNPLGGVRFSMTNSQAIYLHDSPGAGQYSRSNRALSSGCVRVADPVGLASWIHGAQGSTVSRSQIQSDMQASETKFVSLPRPIDVSLIYLTAWSDASGKLHFARDIYGLDGALAAQVNRGL